METRFREEFKPFALALGLSLPKFTKNYERLACLVATLNQAKRRNKSFDEPFVPSHSMSY